MVHVRETKQTRNPLAERLIDLKQILGLDNLQKELVGLKQEVLALRSENQKLKLKSPKRASTCKIHDENVCTPLHSSSNSHNPSHVLSPSQAAAAQALAMLDERVFSPPKRRKNLSQACNRVKCIRSEGITCQPSAATRTCGRGEFSQRSGKLRSGIRDPLGDTTPAAIENSAAKERPLLSEIRHGQTTLRSRETTVSIITPAIGSSCGSGGSLLSEIRTGRKSLRPVISPASSPRERSIRRRDSSQSSMVGALNAAMEARRSSIRSSGRKSKRSSHSDSGSVQRDCSDSDSGDNSDGEWE